MTSRKFTVVLCVFLPVACACGVLFLTCAFAVEIWNHAHMYYATTENESAFLKSYEPIKVIERFCEPGQGLSYATDNSGGAGHTSVTHGAEFDFYIVMKPEKWMPLMNGLRGDLEQQLTNSGAQILSEAGSPRDGFHFQYRIGNSFGSVAILPLSLTSPSTIHRNMPLPEGMLDDRQDSAKRRVVPETARHNPKHGHKLNSLVASQVSVEERKLLRRLLPV